MRSLERKMFLASCWVKVLPPCTVRPALRLTTIARPIASGDTPSC
ncbi:Uncharacterised protein [Vibrio cholerae]|nr:Uncharacterised protein [Vibrio cholerae]